MIRYFIDSSIWKSKSLLWESIQLWTWWLEIYYRKVYTEQDVLWLELIFDRPGLVGADELFMNTQLTGVKIRGFLGDYCIRTRCPSIKTRHVKLLFIYSTFCSMLCVLTLSTRCPTWKGTLYYLVSLQTDWQQLKIGIAQELTVVPQHQKSV